MAIIYGCTNFNSVNYNSLATVDDGSCIITGTRLHNITGELTQQLLAAGNNINISSLSLTNINFGGSALVDLYVERQLKGKFYLLKKVEIPVGATLTHDITGMRTEDGDFGLFIKLTKSDVFTLTGSINPGNSTTTVPGTNTLFLSEVVIGDEIVVTGETKTVTAIASDTSLTVNTTFSDDLATDSTPDCNPKPRIDVILS
tara:strand:- start:647 stop:1249 length:603 start_codon:yes stop_codon:yes gene_type:complete